MKTIFITDNIYLEHDTKEHPESKQRLIDIIEAIEPIKDKLNIHKPLIATKDNILTIHSYEHYLRIKEACELEEYLDGDTPTSTGSFNAALYAVGAGIKGINLIKEQKAKLGFCAIRPPGHHATPTKSMGFCLFNNIAITARYAQSQGFKRVFIIDFDVHHGNGTQDAFYSDNSVFYFSTHQAFAYPGSGNPDEIGIGEGEGYTFNYPLMPNSTDRELLEVYRDDLPKLIDSFNPDIILVSAGYDLHESDPLAQLDITHDGIREMVEIILNQKVNVPKLLFLEGGYNTKALGVNVRLTLEAMIEKSKD